MPTTPRVRSAASARAMSSPSENERTHTERDRYLREELLADWFNRKLRPTAVKMTGKNAQMAQCIAQRVLATEPSLSVNPSDATPTSRSPNLAAVAVARV